MKKIIAIIMTIAFALCSLSVFAEEPVGYEELSKGSKGDAVKALQERLKELGYYSISVDGDYGNGTVNAVNAFQARNELPQNGIATIEMQEVLFSENARKAPMQPGVSVVKVNKKRGYVSYSLKNNLNETVDDIWTYMITYDKNGKVCSGGNMTSEYNPLSLVYTAYDLILKPGKSSSYISREYNYGNIIDTVAIGVAQYRAESGMYYLLRPEQVTYLKSDGTVILPTDDEEVFSMTNEDYLNAKSFNLGGNTVWITPYLEELYGYPAGKYLVSVEAGSIYDKAGLKAGDVIISYGDNKAYWRYAELVAQLDIKNGTTVDIQYNRNGEIYTTQLGGINNSNNETQNEDTVVSVADEIYKLADLLEKGLITQEEYDAQKAKLLGE